VSDHSEEAESGESSGEDEVDDAFFAATTTCIDEKELLTSSHDC
jgi:hypothetical protein